MKRGMVNRKPTRNFVNSVGIFCGISGILAGLANFSILLLNFLILLLNYGDGLANLGGLLNGRLLLNTSISYKFKNYLDWRIPNLFFLPLQNKNFL